MQETTIDYEYRQSETTLNRDTPLVRSSFNDIPCPRLPRTPLSPWTARSRTTRDHEDRLTDNASRMWWRRWIGLAASLVNASLRGFWGQYCNLNVSMMTGKRERVLWFVDDCRRPFLHLHFDGTATLSSPSTTYLRPVVWGRWQGNK